MNFLNYFLNVAYKIVYFYSCFEIYLDTRFEEFTKTPFARSISKQISNFKECYFPEVLPIQQYLFIENGIPIMIYKNFEKEKILIFEPENYDFIIRNDYQKNMNFKIIYNRYADIGDYKISSVSFLSFAIFYKDKIIDISLETKNYSYMIVGNEIDNRFIYYLLKNMNIVEIPDFDYTIQIITQDVDILTLNSKQKIIIDEKKVIII